MLLANLHQLFFVRHPSDMIRAARSRHSFPEIANRVHTIRYVLQAPVGGHWARDWAEHYTTPRACTDVQYELHGTLESIYVNVLDLVGKVTIYIVVQ